MYTSFLLPSFLLLQLLFQWNLAGATDTILVEDGSDDATLSMTLLERLLQQDSTIGEDEFLDTTANATEPPISDVTAAVAGADDDTWDFSREGFTTRSFPVHYRMFTKVMPGDDQTPEINAVQQDLHAYLKNVTYELSVAQRLVLADVQHSQYENCSSYDKTFYYQFKTCADVVSQVTFELAPGVDPRLVQEGTEFYVREFIKQYNGQGEGNIQSATPTTSKDIYLISKMPVLLPTAIRFVLVGVTGEMMQNEAEFMMATFESGFGQIMFLTARPPLNITSMNVLLQQHSKIRVQDPSSSTAGSTGGTAASEGMIRKLLRSSTDHHLGRLLQNKEENYNDVYVLIEAQCEDPEVTSSTGPSQQLCTVDYLQNFITTEGNKYTSGWLTTLKERQGEIKSHYFTGVKEIYIDGELTDHEGIGAAALYSSSARPLMDTTNFNAGTTSREAPPPLDGTQIGPLSLAPMSQLWLKLVLIVDGILLFLACFCCFGLMIGRLRKIERLDLKYARKVVEAEQAAKKRQQIEEEEIVVRTTTETVTYYDADNDDYAPEKDEPVPLLSVSEPLQTEDEYEQRHAVGNEYDDQASSAPRKDDSPPPPLNPEFAEEPPKFPVMAPYDSSSSYRDEPQQPSQQQGYSSAPPPSADYDNPFADNAGPASPSQQQQQQPTSSAYENPFVDDRKPAPAAQQPQYQQQQQQPSSSAYENPFAQQQQASTTYSYAAPAPAPAGTKGTSEGNLLDID